MPGLYLASRGPAGNQLREVVFVGNRFGEPEFAGNRLRETFSTANPFREPRFAGISLGERHSAR